MHDQVTFEARLADAYERYLAHAPVEVDPVSLASAIATSTARPGGSLARLAVEPRRRLLTLGVVALLLVATLATLLLVVGRLIDRPSVPRVYRDVLVTGPSLPEPRGFPALALLGDGRVLVLGGDVRGGTTGLLLDPETGSSAALPALASAGDLVIDQAVRMTDGRVLLMGDLRPSDGRQVPFVRIFDPAAMTFADAGPMVVPRVSATAAALADGRVLVIGGWAPGLAEVSPEDQIRTIELYDPRANGFTAVGDLPLPPTEVTRLRSLPDGGAAVVFEVVPFGAGRPSDNRIYTWDAAASAFREAARTRVGTAAPAPFPHNPEFLPLRDGRIALVGDVWGEGDGLLPRLGVVWDPRAGTFTPAPAAPWRFGAAHVLDDGRLLLLSAPNSVGGGPADVLATVDLDTGATTLVGGHVACFPSSIRLLDGRVALIGGLEDCETHDMANGGRSAPPVAVVQYFE